MLPPLQVHDADEIGDDLIVGAEVGDCAHISYVAAEAGEILAEARAACRRWDAYCCRACW